MHRSWIFLYKLITYEAPHLRTDVSNFSKISLLQHVGSYFHLYLAPKKIKKQIPFLE